MIIITSKHFHCATSQPTNKLQPAKPPINLLLNLCMIQQLSTTSLTLNKSILLLPFLTPAPNLALPSSAKLFITLAFSHCACFAFDCPSFTLLHALLCPYLNTFYVLFFFSVMNVTFTTLSPLSFSHYLYRVGD